MIDGIAIGGYRSFGNTTQLIGPLTKVNLFIGPNNCGKSNILRFVAEHLDHTYFLQSLGNAAGFKAELDDPLFPCEHRTIGIGLRANTWEQFKADFDLRAPRQIHMLQQVLGSLTGEGESLLWFLKQTPLPSSEKNPKPWTRLSIISGSQLDLAFQACNSSTAKLSGLAAHFHHKSNVTDYSSQGHRPDILSITELLGKRYIGPLPARKHIPAFRAAKDLSNVDVAANKDLISRLRDLRSPEGHGKQWREDRNRFDTIVSFVRGILQNQSVDIDITFSGKIQIVTDAHTLPLSSLGTGVEEIVIIAAYCTLNSGMVICLEEPEIHLHPIAQRLLINHLYEHTDNQYFISTHSNHLIDSELASVFSVWQEDNITKVAPAPSSHHRWAICERLGCRASDILQANCVIWVEGPSDRIYLNHWIRAAGHGKELVEGIHYSIMFYSGSCISYIGVGVEEIDYTAEGSGSSRLQEFVDLLTINRNCCLIIDSDKCSEDAPVRTVKLQVAAQVEEMKGFAWITAGRTIENYIPKDVREFAVRKRHPRLLFTIPDGPYDIPLPVDDRNVVKVDKVDVAKEVAELDAKLDALDLRIQIDRLVAYIREKNGVTDLRNGTDPARTSVG